MHDRQISVGDGIDQIMSEARIIEDLLNDDDATQMNTARWRNAVAQSIATAVDQYFAPTAGASNFPGGAP